MTLITVGPLFTALLIMQIDFEEKAMLVLSTCIFNFRTYVIEVDR